VRVRQLTVEELRRIDILARFLDTTTTTTTGVIFRMMVILDLGNDV